MSTSIGILAAKLLGAKEKNQPNEEEVAKFLRLLSSEGGNEKWTDSFKRSERVGRLKTLSALFSRNDSFKVGDIVIWKEGLKNRKRPDYGEPVIVMNTIDSKIYDSTEDAGSPYFREPLTLILGIIDDEGDLALFHFDGRRFEHAEV